MTAPGEPFDLEGGIVRAPLAHLELRDLLMRGLIWLHEIFDDGSLLKAGLLPGDGNIDFRWCLQVAGPAGVLLQLGLRRPVFEALGIPEPTRALFGCLALAEHWVSPLRPALSSFFGQDIELRLEEAHDGWPDAGPTFAFQLTMPSMPRNRVPGRLADAFVPTLRDLVRRHMPQRSADVPLRLVAGTRLCLPVSQVRHLGEGDVVLCDDADADAKSVRIYAESAAAKREWRYLATVRASDGQVQHLAPFLPFETRAPQERMDPQVSLDVVEACLDSSSAACRSLAIGRCVHEWHRAAWRETPELRVGGRAWAQVRPTRLAGRSGYEIVKLHKASIASS